MTEQVSTRLRFLLRAVDERRGERDLPLLSVSQYRGVIPRAEVTTDEPRANDLSNYKICRPGDIVINRMSAYQGAVGRSAYVGIVSPDYIVMRPSSGVDSRWLHHMMRSSWFVAEMASRIRGIGSIGTGNVRTPRVSAEDIGDIRVRVPELAQQRTIAGYLDAETSRIDAIVEQRRRHLDLLGERTIALSHATVTGRAVSGPRTDRCAAWLGTIPKSWPLAPVGSQFLVQLGRMLNAERAREGDMRPYVRNINVRWDIVDVTDVDVMDFPASERSQYRLRAGDLLVNEGGAGIGRAALWRGNSTSVTSRSLYFVSGRSGTATRNG